MQREGTLCRLDVVGRHQLQPIQLGGQHQERDHMHLWCSGLSSRAARARATNARAAAWDGV